MPRDKDGVERLAVPIQPAGDNGKRFDGGGVGAVQVGEHPELVDGQFLEDLLRRVHRVAHLDEADHVPGDAAGECHEVLDRPVGQRNLPRQGNQP